MQNPPNEPQPSYPPQAPLAQLPKKRSRGKFFAIGCGSLVLLLVIIGIVIAATSANGSGSNAQATATSAPTTQSQATQPTQAPQHWTTTHTFTGNGSKKTAIFTAPSDWKIIWKCDPASFDGSYNVIVDVTGSDGNPVDPGAVNTICKAGNTGDSTEEHQGGQVYLDITSEGAWTITIQELK